MPRGYLDIIIDGQDQYDGYDDWGLSLSNGAISTLLAPPATKQRVSNTSRLEDGKRTDITTPVRYEARELTLEMHIVAPTFDAFLTKYRSFINTISKAKTIYFQYNNYGKWMRFNFKYLSCQQFGVYNGTLGKFAVRFEESNPKLGEATMEV